MSLVIERPQAITIGVDGVSGRFPVNTLFCVGRNYADHAIEMGSDPSREPPFFFIKPSFAVCNGVDAMTYPQFSNDVHHEVELVVALSRGGRSIRVEDAMSHVYGYCTGIDMTRRDLQAQAKQQSRPWEAGKSFYQAAPCGDIKPIEQAGPMTQGSILLTLNGKVRQSGDINQMIWKVPEIISRLSELFVLTAGDLIFTGTPAGVGPILPGDDIEATIEGLAPIKIGVSRNITKQ